MPIPLYRKNSVLADDSLTLAFAEYSPSNSGLDSKYVQLWRSWYNKQVLEFGICSDALGAFRKSSDNPNKGFDYNHCFSRDAKPF